MCFRVCGVFWVPGVRVCGLGLHGDFTVLGSIAESRKLNPKPLQIAAECFTAFWLSALSIPCMAWAVSQWVKCKRKGSCSLLVVGNLGGGIKQEELTLKESIQCLGSKVLTQNWRQPAFCNLPCSACVETRSSRHEALSAAMQRHAFRPTGSPQGRAAWGVLLLL